jgi:hypothetical protein
MHLSECVEEMTQSDPRNRPAISALRPLIQSCCTLLDLHTLEEFSSMPEYIQWKEMISESQQDPSELLADWYHSTGQKEAAVQLVKALVNKFPDRKDGKECLAETYKKRKNWNAISTWINAYPTLAQDIDALCLILQSTDVNYRNLDTQALIDIFVPKSPYEIDALQHGYKAFTGADLCSLLKQCLLGAEPHIIYGFLGIALRPQNFDIWLTTHENVHLQAYDLIDE